MNEMNKFLSLRTEMEACKDVSPIKTCKKLKKKGKCDTEAAEKNCKKTCGHCDDEEVQEGKFLRIIQSYEINSPSWTILWFRILGIFSVENIARLGIFMFETSDSSQLCIDSQYSSQ